MCYVNLPDDRAIIDRIVKRSILIKEVIDVISEAKDYNGLLQNVDKEKLFPILESGKRFKFNIEGIGRKISIKEQIEIIESFGIFPFSKNVDLKNPEIIFKVIENAVDHVIYFGTEVTSNRVEEDTFHYKFDLKKRPYLGPTSTDHQLAFLMAN
jgi:tRNA G10  N-methylase Trm11